MRWRRPCLAAFLLAVLGGCAPAPTPVRGLVVVADPGPFGTVEQAAEAADRVNWWDGDSGDDHASTAGFAAAELARFLPACFGLPPESVRLSAALPDTGDAIVIGDPRSSPLVKSLVGEADLSSAAPGGFRLRALGRGKRRLLVIAGDDRAGALYGAYALLERLGTTFPGLGDAGTVTPASPSAWPARLDVAERPAFATRGFWAWEPRGHRDFFLWMARNRMNQWTSADTAFVPLMKQLGFRLTGGGHTLQSDFLPPTRYFREHPEWYGLHGGERSPAIRGESGDNFCTSNAEARGVLARNLVDALERGSLRQVDLLELWMLDGGRWCECDPCRAQGSPTERVLALANHVDAAADSARRAGRLGRPVEVTTLAYLETLDAPVRDRAGPGAAGVTFFPYFRCYAHGLFDSTCGEINRRIAAAYHRWGPAGVRLGVCEYYNVAAFKTLPLIFPRVMAADLARYQEASLGQGRIQTMHAPTRRWGCWTLGHRLLSRLAWDPGQDPDTLVARFCREVFPAGFEAMREHYRQLEIASANIVALQISVGVYGTNVGGGGRLAHPAARLLPLAHLQPAESHPASNDAPDLDQIERAMAAARVALDRASAAGGSAIERARLDDERDRFAYGEAMLAFYIGLIRTAERHRAGDATGARAAFAPAERAAAALRRITDLVQVSASHANASDGLEASGVKATWEFFRQRYAAR